jgi:hypothetical protein
MRSKKWFYQCIFIQWFCRSCVLTRVVAAAAVYVGSRPAVPRTSTAARGRTAVRARSSTTAVRVRSAVRGKSAAVGWKAAIRGARKSLFVARIGRVGVVCGRA